MSVVRVHKRSEHPYVQLERATLRIPTLSIKARGLWAICMSHPDDWEFRLDHLVGLSASDGATAVRSAMKELDAHNLARLRTLRTPAGTVEGKRWSIYENADLCLADDAPADVQETSMSVVTDVQVNRRSENPDVGEIEPNVLESKEDEVLESSGTERAQAREAAAASHSDSPPTPKPPPLPDIEERRQSYQLLRQRGVPQDAATELAMGENWRLIAPLVQRFLREQHVRQRDGEEPLTYRWLIDAVRKGYNPESRPKQATTHTGRLPEAERNMDRLRRERESGAPPARSSVVARAMAEIEQAQRAGSVALHERQLEIAQQRRSARRPPPTEPVADTA
ncbi:MAG: hypothetical protein Rubg2KO_15230 [Rubricoccaceae bacterium]